MRVAVAASCEPPRAGGVVCHDDGMAPIIPLDDAGNPFPTRAEWVPPRVVLAVGGRVRDIEGGAFFVDPDGVEECIRKLRAAADELGPAIQQARRAVFRPPGNDHVSTNMARQAEIMSTRAVLFIEKWQQQIMSTVAALEAQLAAYRKVDEHNAGLT